MPISPSPTLSMLAYETDPAATSVGFTFPAAWPESEQGSVAFALAIGEVLDLVRSTVSRRFRGAETTSAVIVAPTDARRTIK
jgi:hypothetical protein